MRIPGITRIPYFAGNMSGKKGTTVHTFVLFLIWDPHECKNYTYALLNAI